MRQTIHAYQWTNLDPSYILDFGDVLEIQLIGQNDIGTYAIEDGSINLPYWKTKPFWAFVERSKPTNKSKINVPLLAPMHISR